MGQTKIEWATDVWNPVTGCTPVSEGCANCYAKRMAHRLRGRFGYPADDPFRVTLHPERLEEPMRWKKPRRVFVCSMGDLFHPDVPFEFIDKVFAVMGRCQHHTFLLLTKRPERLQSYVKSGRYQPILDAAYSLRFRPEGLGMGISNPKDMRWWPHVWLGVTCENQARADERIPILLQVPAAVRFVSCEPLLGPVDLTKYFPWTDYCPAHDYGDPGYPPAECPYCKHMPGINLVICGGETGPGARPMHPGRVRSLRDQAVTAGVPFFFKSWGKHIPSYDAGERSSEKGQYNRTIGECWVKSSYRFPDGQVMVKVGKKAAGRLLDGRTWDEMPGVGGERPCDTVILPRGCRPA